MSGNNTVLKLAAESELDLDENGSHSLASTIRILLSEINQANTFPLGPETHIKDMLKELQSNYMKKLKMHSG